MNSPRLPLHEARTCNIVTFYDDFISAMRACTKFTGLARRFADGLRVRASSWSFRMLGMSQLAAAVLRDATSADVLVVAASGDRDLPPHIAEWVEDCLTSEPKAEPAVVALLDEALDTDSSAAFCSSLEAIAIRCRARFFSSRDLAAREPRDFRAAPDRHAPGKPVRRHEMGPYPIVTPRWWGINE